MAVTLPPATLSGMKGPGLAAGDAERVERVELSKRLSGQGPR